MPRKRLHTARVAAFWFGIGVSILAPTFLGAWLIPSQNLATLVDGARWGGPLWFGVVAGLAGVLRHRLRESLSVALEGDHWRDLERRHKGVEFLERRLDKMVALSLILGLFSFFVPYAHTMAHGVWADIVAAVPFGAAAYVLWSFFLWTQWRGQVDRLSGDLAVEKRRKEQAEKQMKRLREDEYSPEPRPPKVKTAQPIDPRTNRH